MSIQQTLHPVKLKPPFYQDDDHCGLHRYLDADFVNRFKQDMQRRQFDLPQFSDWQQEELHSPHGQEPVLRLPLHRAFHLVSCEVVCDRFGEPALDPRKITSAGFVIRRVGGNGSEKAWMLEDGEALGWLEAPSEQRDPDLHRRLCASGVLHKRDDQASYSGEEVHPLHVLKTTDAAKKTHTLLFGYLPLGGFFFSRDVGKLIDSEDQEKAVNIAARILSWPFGFRNPAGLKGGPINQTWLPEHSKPLRVGIPSKAMFELLRMLVNRYHLGESGIAENAELEGLFQRLWLYDEAQMPVGVRQQSYNENSQGLFMPYRKQHLLAYLQACCALGGANPLVKWIVDQEQHIEEDAAGNIDKLAAFDPLPNADGQGSLRLTLWLVSDDAQEIRNVLGQRLRDQTLTKFKEIPLPKFGQNPGDVYQVAVFVRSLNDQGREQIQWADLKTRSRPFRVAAPFDPEASRPSMIQMPSLADLRRGLAKGAAMITPDDTFNLMDKLKLNKGASEDVLPEDTETAASVGIQWICSFSLPVITLVAMILLMIMISLLNIVFFWLPWVRICLPFPKFK